MDIIGAVLQWVRRAVLLWAMGGLAVAGLLLWIGIFVGRTHHHVDISAWRLWTIVGATFVFGAMVGAAETISRYRDEPYQALTSPSALTYLSLNGLLSLAAFGLLDKYAASVLPAVKGDLLLTSRARPCGRSSRVFPGGGRNRW